MLIMSKKTLARCACLALLCLPFSAQSEHFVSASLGNGPAGYRSVQALADLELGGPDWLLNLDHFRASSNGDITTASSAGISWYAPRLFNARYRYGRSDDGTLAAASHEFGAEFALHELWQGELRTTLDLGYTTTTQTAQGGARRNNVYTLPEQQRLSFLLTQGLLPSTRLFLGHDQYRYARDPSALAMLIVRRTGMLNAALTVLNFPDHSNSLGLRWEGAAWRAEISSARTDTHLRQQFNDTRLKIGRNLGQRWEIGATLTRSRASEVRNNAGALVQAASSDRYLEVTLGYAF